ncbi:NXN protein [Trypanosoma grayi]|uniref:NXN protein n=1 Tax=Trypanosoma grayi TaxID=71804 RepID=UPI0004F423E1|nr:NXN protein [Trypanosoma grayi]KEG08962.1 NXN protein [Trypanosoma grayi]
MYRSLVFTTNQHYCLHSLALVVRPRQREQLHTTAFQAGELTRRVHCEGCIAIHRYNADLAVRELHVPARLLQGLLPSALLEAFLFWQDEEDDKIRGYPLGDAQDYWFSYTLEVRLRRGAGDCIVTRRSGTTHQPSSSGGGRRPQRQFRGAKRPKTETAVSANEEVEVTQAQVALVCSALPYLTDATCCWLLQRTHGDVAAAIQQATDPDTRDAVAAVDNEERQKEHQAEENEEGTTHHDNDNEIHEEKEAPLVLLNLLQNVELFPLLQLLTRLEDCSHILVWGRASATQPRAEEGEKGTSATLADVVSIELPRLRAKLHPHVDTTTGRLRLHLADHPGWYIAEADDIPHSTGSKKSSGSSGGQDFLHQLQRPFQECVTLCNSTNDFALMVPNHDFTPMNVQDDPFSPLLLFDRASLRWQENVPSPFYLYAVHPCGSFLTPPTLAASLYYAVVQCATRHYAGAMRTLESCYTDSAFTGEEAFMFGLMERTLQDRFPDAHAVRLKLAHAVQYGPQELPWALHIDLSGYLQKKRHVSQACQLTRDEVIDLLRRCSKAVPIIHAQLQLWAGLLKAEQKQQKRAETKPKRRKSCGDALKVTLQTPRLDRCGYPWEHLLQYRWSRIAPQRPRRVTYEAPPTESLQEQGLVEFLWQDKLLSDEESGANSKLGFYFLYCLKKDKLTPKLFGGDVRVTLTQLLTRWFHLRHARWGREALRDGETEVRPSWCGAVLQLFDIAPSAGWPDTLSDMQAQYRMRRGVNMTETTGEGMAAAPTLMQFYQALDRVARTTFESNAAVQQQRERWQLSQSRTVMQRKLSVRMTDHLRPRVAPANTGQDQLQLAFRAFRATAREALLANEEEESNGGAVMQRRLLALFGAPLSEVEVLSRFIHTEPAVRRGCDGRLPFDLRRHAQCSTPLAQHMLERLEEDAARFAQQQQQQMHRSLTALSRERMQSILCEGRTAAAVQGELATATEDLQQCIAALSALSAGDNADVRELTASVLHLANDVPTDGRGSNADEADAALHVRDFRLQRLQGSRCAVPLEWLLGALLSTDMAADLQAVNPFHGDVARLRADLVLLMLLANRSYMAQQAKQSVRQLVLFLELCALLRGVNEKSDSSNANMAAGQTAMDARRARLQELLQRFSVGVDVEALEQCEQQRQETSGGSDDVITTSSRGSCPVRCLPEDVVAALESRMQQLANEAIDLLTARRHYATMCGEDNAAVALDPRYLLFEFMHNILLRARQVEMVRWFVDNTRAGVSRVQQMIMGQGKTTVVGPLLALILADGEQLVTQVMPTALLEQTRGILRRCFSVVVPKQIYTLHFDRAFDDTNTSHIALLQQKLTAAARTRAILISAPECIKSVFLKSIEQLHIIETTPTEELDAAHDAVDERTSAHAQGLLRRTQQRSAVADAITPIIQLWQRGVLIMDEVDVLLHPLRSELNFPIGLKHPIDLSGPRWTLPIHLLDAVFFYQRGRTATDGGAETAAQQDQRDNGARSRLQETVLAVVHDAIAKGYETRALQREPHLVLLDHAYYQELLLPALLPWAQLWLFEQIEREKRRGVAATCAASASSLEWQTFVEITTAFLQLPERPDRESTVGFAINANFRPFAIQLLCLAHDWLHRLLPHVLAKINRVSFGLLQPQELALTDPEERERMPLSRRMMAIPFVAKDVPSRSSEFAHPDVVIGLTILAFRYEGMRLADVKELLVQLKQDFARQSGPKEHRPAAKLYHHWLRLSASLVDGETDAPPSPSGVAAAVVPDRSGIPLSQLQVTDEVAMHALHRRLRHLPEVVHYYLCSHVFPRTMNFQGMKISACGHELGSSMLFTQRIGFSGTPSNLLPLDLGECFYEPGSDGRVLSVLTDPAVVTAEVLPPDWMPLRVLDRIATAHPPYHALIDAGALITNMENEDVARYLLGKLSPTLFDGVVFLDRKDRQMILQRSNGLKVPVAQSGIALTRRFTFFDQVHTTGTDIKQAASVTAIVTLGKDLVFRDYAQGAYRMRGVGKGQRLRLYLIPEVLARIHATLGAAETHNLLLDVPVWLLLNSMQMEGLQFIKLTTQELANVWRKKALQYLLADSIHANAHPDAYTDMARCRRFHMQRPPITSTGSNEPPLPTVSLLRSSIHEFRELIAYPVDSCVDTPVPFLQRLTEQMNGKPQELIKDDGPSQELLRGLMQRIGSSLTSRGGESSNIAKRESSMNLDSEVVHEQEAEEEQEQEAEQEEQRISVASRDDEFHIPWRVETLQTYRDPQPAKGSCFYPLHRLRVRPQQPLLLVDATVQISDNYYRENWHGVGERRLKNAFLMLEWVPPSPKEQQQQQQQQQHQEREETPEANDHVVYAGLVTLAEGESLRWMMHHPSGITASIRMALRVVSNGRYMDATDVFAATLPHVREQRIRVPFLRQDAQAALTPAPTAVRDGAVLLYRFFNNDMFFSNGELAVLEQMLCDVTHADRLQFFMDCLRARRRHRNHWDDAPVAALFVPAEDRESMRPLAILSALRVRFEELQDRVMTAKDAQKLRLIEQLQSFHTRAEKIAAKKNNGRQQHQPASSRSSVPMDAVARLLHDVFSAVMKPFTLHDVEQTLRYLCHHESPGLTATRATTSPTAAAAAAYSGMGDVSVTLSHLTEAFPVLREEFLKKRLEEAGEPVVCDAEPWHCPTCTLLNDPAMRRCAACNSVNPSASGETANSAHGAEQPWQCPQCTFINASRQQPVCSVCLTANPSPLVDAQQSHGDVRHGLSTAAAWECPSGYWVCSVEHGGCSKFNPNDVFYCQVCDKARPNLASLRF